MRKILTLAVVVVAPVAMATAAYACPADTEPCAPETVAHRGGTEAYAENTRKAFEHAYANGAHTVELDVRFTSTNIPMVLHDPTLDRVTNGSGRISDMTYTEVRKFRTEDGQKIPTLWEVLADGKDNDARYIVELKENPDSAEWRKFNTRFDALNVKDNSIVASFSKSTVAEASARGYETAWIDGRGFVYSSELEEIGADILMKSYKGITSSRVDYWNSRGIDVYAWTPNTLRQWNRFEWYGPERIKGIITDKPVEYGQFVKNGCTLALST